MNVATGSANQQGHGKYRRDIDGLRGVAILGVLAGHNFPEFVPNGFFGIDVFFVVSGLLITRLVIDRIDAGTFTFAHFFSRRIRRILPALTLVLLATMLTGALLMHRFEFEILARHFVASLFFFQNFQLMGEAGYFDFASLLKPLRHVWSLAVEEQFYIVWPAALVIAFTTRIDRAWLAGLLILVSFAYAVLGFEVLADSYYSPFARAWELLCGALAAILLNRFGWDRLARWGDALVLIGGALIAFSMLVPLWLFGNAPWTPIFPVLGTLMVIAAGQGSRLSRWTIQNGLLVWTGLVSYSLYLWHWPMLSFPAMVLDGMVPYWMRLAGIAASFTIAWASWKYVEEPARRVWTFRKLSMRLFAIVAASCVIIVIALLRPLSAQEQRIAEVNDLMAGWSWDYAENATCREAYGDEADTFCFQSRTGRPDIMLIGDSYANHLTPGIIGQPAFADMNVLSIGRCRPVAWTSVLPDQCGLQDRVLAANEQVELVVFGGEWPNIDPLGRYDFSRLVARIDDPGGERFRADLLTRLQSFARPGRRIVVIGPKPDTGYHVKQCFGRPLIPARETCRIASEDIDPGSMQRVLAMLEDIVAEVPGAILVDQSDAFCDESGCNYLDEDGMPLLRDFGHLSTFGSDAVGRLVAEELADQANGQPDALPLRSAMDR